MRIGKVLKSSAPFFVAALCAWFTPCAPAFSQADPAPAKAPPTDESLLFAPETPRADRDSAADRLLASSDWNSSRTVLSALDSASPAAARVAILRAIARSPFATGTYWNAVAAAAYVAPAEELPETLAAVASFRSRVAAQLLTGFLEAPHPVPVRDAAQAGLVRLTGRADLPTAQKSWNQWLAEMAPLSERQWQAEVIRGVAGRNDALRRERQTMVTRLVESQREFWLTLREADARERFLASLLRDELDELKRLGIDLTRQAVATGERPGAEVASAAIELLASPRAAMRAEGAKLVNQLAPEGAGPAVVAALNAETDPRAAEALLAALRRWPSRDAEPAILHWLDRGGSSTAFAADACLAMERNGLLTDAEMRTRVLTALRAADSRDLQSPGMRLLTLLGDDTDFARVEALLTSEGDASLRAAAAEAVATDPRYGDALIRAAAKDPSLLGAAVRNLSANRATLDGLRALLAAVPADSPPALLALAQLAAAAPLTDVLAFAGDESLDPRLREAALGTIAPRPLPEGPDELRQAVARGLLLLAELRLKLLRPDAALAATDAADQIENSPIDDQELADLRSTALLLAGRFDEVGRLSGSSASWMNAMELAIDEPATLFIAEDFDRRFAHSLEGDELSRYSEIRQRLGLPPLDRVWGPEALAVDAPG